MPNMIERIKEIGDLFETLIPDRMINFNLKGDGAIIKAHRFLSVSDYIKTKNSIEVFRAHLRKATEYQIQLFERYRKGENVSPSFVDARAFKSVFDALASGDWSLTQKLMTYVSATDIKEIKGNTYYHVFFKYFILGHPLEESIFSKAIEDYKKISKSYLGYVLAFKALYDKNIPAFEEAFKEIMKGHNYLTRIGNDFGDTEDEVIAIWPLGIVNLAKFLGLDVHVESPLVPQALILTLEEAKASIRHWEETEKKTFHIPPPHPKHGEKEAFFAYLQKHKVPEDWQDYLYALDQGKEDIRVRFVHIFNEDKQFKRFKKFVPILPKELVEKFLTLILSKSSYHQKQCDEIRVLLK